MSRMRAAIALAVAVVAVPALAHHSYAMFDLTKKVTLKGTVSTFKWSNPHAWLEIQVPGPGGSMERWAVEMTSPNNLVRQGWKRTTFKPGDKATIVAHPLRDGKKGGSLFTATTADGTVLGSASGQGSEAPK
ncbi:MAG: hypothetical protein JWM38_834 [Sphingomonas bacterium]|jgi:hypothetical protein|nr:hypothetical protein [Sphingomonas bacterium]MDB5717407.1 hypothetical protein [Sphingomonas bacterium]